MVLTREELENLFWRCAMIILGKDPDSEDPSDQSRVRISWPDSDTGGGGWERNENVVFLRIDPSPDSFTDQRDVTHEYDPETDTQKEVVTYHRSFSVTFICYGPESEMDADAIRIGLLRDPIRQALIQKEVAVRPDIREPVPIHELDESGIWWERQDVTAYFYVVYRREYDEGIIEHVPVTMDTKADTAPGVAEPGEGSASGQAGGDGESIPGQAGSEGESAGSADSPQGIIINVI